MRSASGFGNGMPTGSPSKTSSWRRMARRWRSTAATAACFIQPGPMRILTAIPTSPGVLSVTRVDELPLETFDATTRFVIFWLRAKGRAEVPKGEARLFAQADELRLDEWRGGSSAGRPLGWVGGVASVPVTAVVQPVIKYVREGQGRQVAPARGSVARRTSRD